MRYLSVCSGIEAATVAWHPLGWEPVAFSEIEPFPCKVLAHHYQTVPNYGDMTKFKEWPDANINVLVGGTPCQSFSIAGLRKGLDDPRGNLMLTYLAIAAKYRPEWVVWENVPGVLSSNGGKDFGTFLAGLGECGYGFAYRVLDAQYVRTDGHPYAVPQRRRRVFVVGCLGNWQRAAAVLFDSESLRGNPPPRRETGKEVAGTFTSRAKSGGWGTDVDLASSGYMRTVPEIAKCLTTGQSARYDSETETETMLPCIAMAGNTIGREPENGGNGTGFDESGSSYTLTKTDVHAVCLPINIQIATRHEAMGEGTGMGIGMDGDVAYTLQAAHSHAVAFGGNVARTLSARHDSSPCADRGMDVVAVAHSFKVRGGCDGGGKGYLGQDEAAFTISTGHDQYILTPAMQVRRLTPLECERLQGFKDNFTNIPGASDSARYKALGNSMAVNVMQLIGQRIQMVETIQ